MSWKGSWGGAAAGNAWGQGKGSQGKGKGAQGIKPSIAPTIQKAVITPKPSISPSAGAQAKGVGKGVVKQEKAPGQVKAPVKQEQKPATPAVSPAQIKAKADKYTKDFASTESVTKTTLETSKLVLENEKASVASMQTSIESLEKQQKKLSEMQTQIQKDVVDGRRAGTAAAASVTELTKLLGQCRTLAQSVTSQINKLKPKKTKMEKEAETKAKETKDAAAFKPILAKAKSEFTSVEIAMSAITKQTMPLIAKPDQEEGEALDKKIEGIATSATEALKKVETAKADILEKMKGTKDYAPEARKTATSELGELQQKIADFSKACYIYKNFKKELPRLAENHKAVVEVTDKLGGHDAQLTKAGDLAKAATLDKEKVKAIDEAVEPVQEAIKSSRAILHAKMKNADAATKPKFTQLMSRCDDISKRIAGIFEKCKAKRDVFKSEEAGETAEENIKKVEDAWTACQEAEMPFLTGVEILPKDVNDSAIKECTEAVSTLSTAMVTSRNHIQKNLKDANTYEKDLKASTKEKLEPLLERLAAIDGKVGKFRKELNDRKITGAFVEAMTAAEAFEKLVSKATETGKPLTSKDLEDEAKETVTDTIEKTKTALGEAGTSAGEVKKILTEKQRETKTQQHHPTVKKIYDEVNAGQAKLQTLKNNIVNAEKVLKAKDAVVAGEEKVKEAEAAAEKAKGTAPAEGAAMTMDSVKALDDACTAAFAAIRVAAQSVQQHISIAPPKAKAALTELTTRKTAAQGVVEKIKTETKERRETAIVDSFLAEGKSKAEAAEAAAGKMDEAESPFLIGATMTLEATQDNLAKCDAALKEVRTTSSVTTQFCAQKTNEARSFGPAAQKSLKEGFAECAERVKKVSVRLAQFEKDFRDRTKDAKMQEAEKMVDDVEALAKKTATAAEPFEKEGADAMSEADAAAPLKVYMEADKETQQKLGATKNFLGAREKEQKGNKEQTEVITKLKERVSKAQEEVVAKKKATAPHEKRSLATRLLAEGKEQAGGVDAEVKKVKEACAPLLEQGGLEFLIGTSMQTLATALRAHMKAKELTEQALFSDAAKSKKKIAEKDFVQYLTELPAAIEHDELSAFSDERRAAIFKRLSADGKAITASDFAGIFKQKYTCVKAVVVSNKFESEGAETVCKVEPPAEVETFGVLKETEDGQMRTECKVEEKTGWITIRQAKAGNYLQMVTPFKAFTTKMDKAISEGSAAVSKVAHSLLGKTKQLNADEARMKEVKEELLKLKEGVDKVSKEIEEVRRSAGNAKRDYSIKEQSERSAHIEARNAKEAAPFLEDPKAKFEALEADAKAAEEAAAAMANLSKEELQAFATPASTLEKVEKAAAAVAEKAPGVREAVKEQEKAVAAVTPPTGGTNEARKQLKNIQFKTEEFVRSTKSKCQAIKSKCQAMVHTKMEPTAAAIRNHAQGKKLSPEALFDSLKSGDKIPEEAFCKMLESLGDAALQPEIAKLLCRKLEADGISKETFMKYVVIYYKVVKTIAYTDELDITKCKTIRKGNEGEVVEVLEGPVHDEANGMTRIRAKSTTEPVIEGWITLSGSKGTAFLEKTVKPASAPAK